MSVLVLFETQIKPEKVSDMKATLAKALPDTRAFDGCQGIDVYFNTEDSSNMVFVEFWDSPAHYEKYLAWRAETGFMETFGAGHRVNGFLKRLMCNVTQGRQHRRPLY